MTLPTVSARARLRLAALLLSLLGASAAWAEGAKPAQFLAVLRPAARLQAGGEWSEADQAAVARHFKRLQDEAAAGRVILAGRTEEPMATTIGLVIFEAEDFEAARRFALADPAVAAGVMTTTVHPYSVAVQRRAAPASAAPLMQDPSTPAAGTAR